jgi:hypothetical protein
MEEAIAGRFIYIMTGWFIGFIMGGFVVRHLFSVGMDIWTTMIHENYRKGIKNLKDENKILEDKLNTNKE